MIPNWLRWPRLLVPLLIAGALALLVLCGLLVDSYNTHRSLLEQQAFAMAQSQAFDAARSISQGFSGVMVLASELSADLSSGDNDPRDDSGGGTREAGTQ